MRVLFTLLLLGVMGYWVVSWFIRSHSKSSTHHNPIVLVACKHCGLHLPKNEAIETPAGYFCSQEHVRS